MSKINLSMIITELIMVVVFLYIAAALYSPITTIVLNITGSGYSNTGMLTLVTTLYWILVASLTILVFVFIFIGQIGKGQRGRRY